MSHYIPFFNLPINASFLNNSQLVMLFLRNLRHFVEKVSIFYTYMRLKYVQSHGIRAMTARNLLLQWVRPMFCTWVLLDLYLNYITIVVELYLILTWCSADSWCILMTENTVKPNCSTTSLHHEPPIAMLTLQPYLTTIIEFHEHQESTDVGPSALHTFPTDLLDRQWGS